MGNKTSTIFFDIKVRPPIVDDLSTIVALINYKYFDIFNNFFYTQLIWFQISLDHLKNETLKYEKNDNQIES
jgi:hypothetical protein